MFFFCLFLIEKQTLDLATGKIKYKLFHHNIFEKQGQQQLPSVRSSFFLFDALLRLSRKLISFYLTYTK